MATTKVSLKLFIDKRSQQQRVLFAEADKEFVDFLFSIFTLPVGVVTRILKEGSGMVGSLQSLYQSIEDLSVTHIKADKGKRFLLEPQVIMPGAKLPLLLPNVASTFRQLYRCPNGIRNGSCICYVADDNSTACPGCDRKMERNLIFVDPPSAIGASLSSEKGYVKGTGTYMVMDDMEVKASSPSTLLSLLTKFNVKEIEDIEEKVVDVGMDEGVKLLKASLQSKTVLTDIFLPVVIINTEKFVGWFDNVLNHIEGDESGNNKMFLMKQLKYLRYQDGTSLTDHFSTFHGIINQLAGIGIKFDDEVQELFLLGTLSDFLGDI